MLPVEAWILSLAAGARHERVGYAPADDDLD
jgi:hypothetical protein